MQRLLNHLCNWKCVGQKLLLSVAVLILATQLFATPANATGAGEVPKPKVGTWVLDQAEILSRSNEGKIATALGDLAKQTGSEVHFVTIHRLDYGETIETFTNKLFDLWFPTQEASANQTLLVLDNLTNNVALSAGDAVKTKLSDELAESVTQETVLIPLKEGNKYNQALLGASDRLVAVLSGRPDPGPPALIDNVQVEGTFATPEQTKESNATIWVIGFLVVATVVPMATYYFYLYLQAREG
ncbi:photosystem II repair protein Psb32 [Stenomitos frigidus]|uniref:Beta-propeller domain-containing protein, methanol dehydrogenase n=1 Tax=Stenomitos frigidus ULC18 TaxID=2107698 RepID=A0A2T1DT99_9CYAN|nr:TPM domain-containing protein [Stenomitos frigidus]PSB23727.1 beta-propeller domain-containing protein, methanol dehydrogenase [Stenomitos frigidus ULC18]